MGTTGKRRGDQRKRTQDPAAPTLRQNNLKNEIVSVPSPDEPWTPGSYAVFKILMSARLCAALWTGISDCDETYNYWEPTHYLIFNKGFQTWEYSPSYAIRSYAYLTLHAFPMKIYAFINVNKIFLFYFLRCILSISCSVTELYFYNGVCKLFGGKVGRLMLWLMLFSTGMFISCSSYLPSSFSMYLIMVAMGAWYQKSYHIAILGVAASALIGWPFSAVLGVPIACDVLLKKKLKYFLYWCCVALILFLVPVVVIDSYYYDKLVIAPLNILLYNIFTEHGPNIYGTEPFSFYFLNGFLNFNIAFILAVLCLPIAFVAQFVCRYPKNSGIPLWLSMAPMFIWIAIFFTRPHKEERFLFPIFPFFALGAAISINYIEDIFRVLFSSKKSSSSNSGYHVFSVICAGIFTLLSLSRTLQLYHGYHAPMDVYLEMNQIATKPDVHTISTDKQVNVCIGKEWYRFPSSFFLPNENWHLRFIKSEFKGQLPKPYYQGPDSTSTIPSHMNDMNMEEPTRYINISKCHYLIDLDVPTETSLEPRYSDRTQEWKVLVSSKFLYPKVSHRIFRAFYVPFVSSQYCTYLDYNLLKAVRPVRPSSNREHL
ncbi:alpha-1,2-mannosyltransferase ALG9-like [Argonauta hians]